MKQNLPPGVEHFSRYATLSNVEKPQQNPLRALQKDAVVNDESTETEDQEMRSIYANQLDQLECLIQTQRNFQNLMKTNYIALMEKYKKTVNELDRLRKEATTTNLNKLTQEKQILERKFHEHARARMILGSMLRTVLRTLRAKCAALDQAQQQLSACEKERDMYKAQAHELKEQNKVLEQSTRKDLRNHGKSYFKEAFLEGNGSVRNNEFKSHSLRIQRSFEVLKADENQPSSLTKSMGRINSLTSSVAPKHRPSLPWNLLRSNTDSASNKPGKPPRKGSFSSPKLVRAHLVLCNRIYSVDEPHPPGRSYDPVQIGSVCIEQNTTWDQFDARVRAILNGCARIIAEATDGNRFSNVLHRTRNSVLPADSQLYQLQASREQAKLDTDKTTSVVRCRLGQLDWTLGSPPTPNSLSVRRLQLLQGISLQDSCSTPFDLCLSLPTPSYPTLPMTKHHSINGSIGHRGTEEVSKLDQKIVLTVDPVAHVSIECGLSLEWVRQYLSVMKLHKRLVFVTNTGWLWTRRLLHSLAGLIMTEVHSTEQPVRRHTLAHYSVISGGDSFNLEDWLCRQNIIRRANNQTVSIMDQSNTTTILIFETMNFLRSAANRMTLSYLLGIPNEAENHPAWDLQAKEMYLLAQSDPLSIEWLCSPIAVQTDLGWLLPLKPHWTAGGQASTSNSMLLHPLALNRTPLIDVVPLQLRLIAHKSALERAEREIALDESSVRKIDTVDLNPDLGEMCRWVESIWTRLYMSIKWLGLNRGQCLISDSQELSQLPTDLFPQFPCTDPNGQPRTGEPSWSEIAKSLITARSDENTEHQIAELLNPDVFSSFPAFTSFLQEDKKANYYEMLKWIEQKWNNEFEPGLQRCISSAAAMESSWESLEHKEPVLYIKLTNPVQARNRVQQVLRNVPSDAAATLFLRQIIMADCPLEGAARLNFSSRLTGGDTTHSRISHPRRLNFGLPEATIPPFSENRGFKPNIRMIDECQVLRRAAADRNRIRGKIGDEHSMDNQNENPTRSVSVPSTRCKKLVHSDDPAGGRVKVSGSGERINETMLTKSRRGSSAIDRVGFSAPNPYRHLRGEEYRPARFWSHSTNSWSDEPSITTVPLRKQTILVHSMDSESR
ncbi:hypothetical protein FGIG_00590 [Fasciola gigantica]|uniref:Cortactin-binding protein-2 N-terminal domain-containing protein n=1 Tax=Fasciola gigantica TaxID=46835 RepID=A0A504YW80_FASGI|nr:hypothetical protein FGIG_00590 [Fasciola gigantica]